LTKFKKIQINCTIDCAVSLSELAISENYTKPILNETFAIDIKEGRHPIIEKSLPLGEKYIPNDVFLDKDSQQIIMVRTKYGG
jgi:DNA mismatch repair protein MutS